MPDQPPENLPIIPVFLDEEAGNPGPEETERRRTLMATLQKLMRMGRASGIHVEREKEYDAFVSDLFLAGPHPRRTVTPAAGVGYGGGKSAMARVLLAQALAADAPVYVVDSPKALAGPDTAAGVRPRPYDRKRGRPEMWALIARIDQVIADAEANLAPARSAPSWWSAGSR